MRKDIEIVFHGNDVLVPRFIRRYINEAKRISGYELRVKYLESILEEISNGNDLPEIPLTPEKEA